MLKYILYILGFFALVVASFELMMPYVAIKRPHTHQRFDKTNFNTEKLNLRTNDSLSLNTFLLRPKQEAKGTIILLHGIGSSHGRFRFFAPMLLDWGLNVVIFDMRAHGKSEGSYCTFGYYEKYDVQRLLDILEQKNIKQPIGVFGSSLGGAVALQTLAIDKRLEFGVIESTFDTYENVALEYGEDIIQFRSPFLTRHILKKAGEIADFDPFSIKPVESCAEIDVPILMSHGSKDNRIPVSFGLKNFNALKTNEKIWELVDGANHHTVHKKGGAVYFEKMKAFIFRQLAKNNTENP